MKSAFALGLALALLSCGSPDDSAPDATLFARPDTSEGYAAASAKTVCAKRHPVDFNLRAACSRNADEGRADFIAIGNRFASDAEMAAALENCFSRHTADGSTDFMLAGACARNQAEAYDDLTP